MKRKLIFCLLFFLFESKSIEAQCIADTIFQTDSLGNKSEKLYFPMIMKIFPDSIKFYNIQKPSEEFLSFAILERKECKWNKDFSKGFSNYRLKTQLYEKTLFPLLMIIYEDKIKKRIELLYDGSEERIFTIAE